MPLHPHIMLIISAKHCSMLNTCSNPFTHSYSERVMSRKREIPSAVAVRTDSLTLGAHAQGLQ